MIIDDSVFSLSLISFHFILFRFVSFAFPSQLFWSISSMSSNTDVSLWSYLDNKVKQNNNIPDQAKEQQLQGIKKAIYFLFIEIIFIE